MPKIKMSKMINPHFYKVWNTDKPYIILNGGRGSFKSSVISLKLATMVKKQTQLNRQVNFILIRENASYLHDSVYKQMEWAFTQLDMYNEFLYFKSPMRIVHKRTGSTFYFYGGDDPMKLKSNIVGNVMAVWYEEAANFKGREVFDQANPTFIRQKPPFIDHVTVYYSYNPPKSPYDWVNEWVEEERKDPDCLVDTSTYLDDERGFTNKEQLKLIERYKKNDYDYYRWLYLGEVVGLGTNIYNMENFQAIDKLPDDDYITNVYYSVDTGHEVSATTCGAYGLTKKGNLILLDTYYYSPQGKSHKKPPSELSKDLKAFIDKVTEWIGKQPTRMTIDSAEGALDNQFYNDYGIHWHKVNKLKKVDMIDRVQDLLAQGRFYYLKRPENDIFIAEHQKYQWDENTLQSDDPKVIKEDDHTCDQFMYLCLDNERDLGLKW
ncbi:PBSX family phage terminase large subunit [Limosilactobacillus reuteri]|uniref:PBSX family phage terminase large subunit n=1 Tax=Limosilactobacillus reuteri TaxID=1598 RepID=UPI001E3A5C96|nr:PBSX family phage terminase large subunit [Limosilactobacillus reuteri]MCC4346125.1 PBSX family phage terminase large subunit [Limosilactobacillus reuteri]